MPAGYLEQTLELARRGLHLTSPNPCVGAILVNGGEVAGCGFHTFAGVKHAETLALEQAGERAKGATLYVNLEPCSHQGRTGACADALIAAGVGKVVAITADPNPEVSGRGFEKLRAAGIEVIVDGTLEAEAQKLNQGFFHYMRTGLPLVTLKSALTLDGKIAAPEDNSGWITSERAREHVQTLRHAHDAMLTGVGTVLSDNPMLNDRSGLERSRPLLRVVADSMLRTPLDHKIVESCQRDVLIFCTSVAPKERRQALEAKGVEVIVADNEQGRVDLRAIIGLLAKRRYLSVMIEAGSKLNWALLEAGIVDRVFFYYAIKILGGLQSLPVAGGSGKRTRMEAIHLKDLTLHRITEDEFAVEAWMPKA
ncbi:MAG TPA: bifunctional diaminohydroxyphosphoribosylaminopyrimidine deaminase/5-amino-6-(5-phosphoribosylamino)uracil reductase RibD [Bryobacteraceae bacterium]|nr:bifunctional diaminohydroxyphosphoribosylaminopyrimidine deaminase/5-amino-6-(5-phosphoribosylamino)uracil reductase RibD [Bryobacteraceae bacterium]HPT27978.1 bifunctional diaminohydroxyphosphoribosylaminopyrimidine deaminase/5-amino-6-(5-phosphoribosylamino)uracil reductase RibD [Bryobacteraceae bacterium]